MAGKFVVPHTIARDVRRLCAADILPLRTYAVMRKEVYAYGMHLSQARKLLLGPFASIDFLSYDGLWIQMLHAETPRGQEPSEQQIAEELEAYNSLIPSGTNLPFTLMLEIENEAQRRVQLSQLGGIEGTITLNMTGAKNAVSDIAATNVHPDVDRTDSSGKTSAVHFLSFEGLRKGDLSGVCSVTCTHRNYSHSCLLSEQLRAVLAKDLID